MKKQASRNQVAQRRLLQKRLRKSARADARRNASQRGQHGLSQSPDLPADKLRLLNAVDSWSGIRGALREIAQQTEQWAGIPMPVEGTRLVLEPHYPNGMALAEIGAPPKIEDEPGIVVRNCFWSTRWKSDIYVYTENGGKAHHAKDPKVHGLALACAVLSVSDVWGIEQEQKALKLLGTLIRHRQFKQYLLTGMFMERSERSGVHYLFRKLRPTVAIKEGTGGPWNGRIKPEMRIIASLCLHPIAYYEGSWAGAMCPTDDVVAHLMLMRGDEAMFWRRANQHPAWRPEAGL